MTTVLTTDKRPWVDARNKEELTTAVRELIRAEKPVDAAAIDAIVEEVGPASSDAGVNFIKRLKRIAKDDLWSATFAVGDACQKASDAYRRIDHAQPRVAGVYGLELAKKLEQWKAAHEVLAQARGVDSQLKTKGAIDTSEAETTIAELAPEMRAFADAYDAMLRGEKAVSEVMPKATMFALFPELKGKDLPALHEALAELTARADEGMLVGLFNHRWLQFDTVERYRVNGPLKGDLNMFVAYLRRDAEKLRNGAVFARSQGFGSPGTDPISTYLRSTTENPDEGFGLIPTFLYQLALPAYERGTFTFGDESRSQLPTYGSKVAPPPTVRIEATPDGAKIIIG